MASMGREWQWEWVSAVGSDGHPQMRQVLGHLRNKGLLHTGNNV